MGGWGTAKMAQDEAFGEEGRGRTWIKIAIVNK